MQAGTWSEPMNRLSEIAGRTAAALLMGLTLWLGWNWVTGEPVEEVRLAEEEWASDEGAYIEEEISSGYAADARRWLQDPSHGMFEGDAALTQALVDDFYRAGAPRVWFIDIVRLGESLLSDSLAVELPPEGPARQRLFQVEAAFWERQDQDSQCKDEGQRYLTVAFD
jgi:hypothetical protein